MHGRKKPRVIHKHFKTIKQARKHFNKGDQLIMAKSNFNHIYSTLPNLYFMTYEEIFLNSQYLPEQEQDQYIEDYENNYRVLTDEDIIDLEALIDEQNKIIQSKGERLYYDSPRQVDQDEGYTLKDIKIFIESGEYEGQQLAVSDDYKYLNKTNKKLIKKCLIKIAKAMSLWGYDLAYRFSNGETGFLKVREY